MSFFTRNFAKIRLSILFAPLIFVLSVVFAPVGFTNLPVNFSVKAALQENAERSAAATSVCHSAKPIVVGVAETSADPTQAEASTMASALAETAAEDAPPPTVVMDEKAPCSFVISIPTFEKSSPWPIRAPDELFPISSSTPQRPPLRA